MSHYSPLRYPGGKSKLAPFLAESLRLNRLGQGVYAEAFIGGGGAALRLLIQKHVAEIAINDLDPLIHAFWATMLQAPEELVRNIKATRLTVRTWKRHKNVARRNARKLVDPIYAVGWSAFFLNRCNRSGVFNAGPIGGMDQKGNYKIDARFNRPNLVERIERVAEHASRIRLYRLPALKFLQLIQDEKGFSRADTLTYLDPPYYLKGPSLYSFYFSSRQHAALSDFLNRKARFRWITSYDDQDEIRALFARQAWNVHNMAYQVHSRRIGRELVIASANCRIPDWLDNARRARKKSNELESENERLSQAIALRRVG
jgi:DNA adenine methylase